MRAVRLGAGRSMLDGTPSLDLRGHQQEQLVTSGLSIGIAMMPLKSCSCQLPNSSEAA